MNNKYLITGFSGFVASHFIDYLNSINEKAYVLGLDITEPEYDYKHLKNINVEFKKVDLLDTEKVEEIINNFKPEYILHLASFSSVAFSWKNPTVSFNNNNNIFLSLLESIRDSGIKCRILSVGSSEEYGIVEEKDIPISEATALNPVSPYSVARISQELLSKIYANGYGLDIIMTRSFNHIGPRQKPIFAIPSFAKQMTQIKKENKEAGVISTGNLDIVRDFLDVRDVVKAYYLLLKNGRTGEIYNVCSGKGVSLSETINIMTEYLGIKIELTLDQKLIRPADNPVIIGNNEKIRSQLSWEPEIPLKESIKDICDFWMSEEALING